MKGIFLPRQPVSAGLSGKFGRQDAELLFKAFGEIGHMLKAGQVRRLRNGHTRLPEQVGGAFQADVADEIQSRLPGEGFEFAVQLHATVFCCTTPITYLLAKIRCSAGTGAGA
jgi:hypothetical protein